MILLAHVSRILHQTIPFLGDLRTTAKQSSPGRRLACQKLALFLTHISPGRSRSTPTKYFSISLVQNAEYQSCVTMTPSHCLARVHDNGNSKMYRIVSCRSNTEDNF